MSSPTAETARPRAAVAVAVGSWFRLAQINFPALILLGVVRASFTAVLAPSISLHPKSIRAPLRLSSTMAETVEPILPSRSQAQSISLSPVEHKLCSAQERLFSPLFRIDCATYWSLRTASSARLLQ